MVLPESGVDSYGYPNRTSTSDLIGALVPFGAAPHPPAGDLSP
ncbi:hypothetical protein SAMN05428953_102618 [Mesorhizobium muleiense]|uniref:Uncharacterized protein n=1 Tax=Mesorhizobium muleiense TaxID=1004279 RepID=A0A1G8MMZ8_9HYPH|nr:hypothetical protein SAMN05428953_102618 [Mesorhizobium muleiense]